MATALGYPRIPKPDAGDAFNINSNDRKRGWAERDGVAGVAGVAGKARVAMEPASGPNAAAARLTSARAKWPNTEARLRGRRIRERGADSEHRT